MIDKWYTTCYHNSCKQVVHHQTGMNQPTGEQAFTRRKLTIAYRPAVSTNHRIRARLAIVRGVSATYHAKDTRKRGYRDIKGHRHTCAIERRECENSRLPQRVVRSLHVLDARLRYIQRSCGYMRLCAEERIYLLYKQANTVRR